MVSVEMAILLERGWWRGDLGQGDSLLPFVNNLGNPVNIPGRGLQQPLLPSDSDGSHHTYTGLFGLGMFPLHTDFSNWATPPRYLVLHSELGFTSVPTLVLDSAELREKVGDGPLGRAQFTARTPRGRFLCNILSTFQGSELFRWDSQFMRPEDEYAREVRARVISALDDLKGGQVSVDYGTGGNLLVVDNWRMLHGRGAVGPGELERRLVRMLVADGRIDV